MNVDSIYGFRLPKQQLFIVKGIPKITAFATHPGSNETRCSKPGFFHLAIKAASWAMVGTVGTVTWKQNQSCLKPPSFNTVQHASTRFGAAQELHISLGGANRRAPCWSPRRWKMFEDVRRCSCYIPWDFPEKKKFKFCNLEIYGNLQSLAKWTAAMFWTSLLLVVELIDIPGRCSVQLIPNYSGFKALVKQKGRPWPFPMDFGDLPSGLEQKNVQSEHRSQKHRLLCADGCSNIRTSPPRCNWPEFKKGRKKWSKSQSLGKVWKVWLFWLVQRMAQRMARICSLPHCGAYLRAVRSPHLASAEPQLF